MGAVCGAPYYNYNSNKDDWSQITTTYIITMKKCGILQVLQCHTEAWSEQMLGNGPNRLAWWRAATNLQFV